MSKPDDWMGDIPDDLPRPPWVVDRCGSHIGSNHCPTIVVRQQERPYQTVVHIVTDGSTDDKVALSWAKWFASIPAIIAVKAPKRQIPDRFHPGEYLKEEIEARGGDFWMLQRKSSLSRITVDAIIAEKQDITRDIANQLEDILGTSAELWLNLQKAYDAKAPKIDDEGLVKWLVEKYGKTNVIGEWIISSRWYGSRVGFIKKLRDAIAQFRKGEV